MVFLQHCITTNIFCINVFMCIQNFAKLSHLTFDFWILFSLWCCIKCSYLSLFICFHRMTSICWFLMYIRWEIKHGKTLFSWPFFLSFLCFLAVSGGKVNMSQLFLQPVDTYSRHLWWKPVELGQMTSLPTIDLWMPSTYIWECLRK